MTRNDNDCLDYVKSDAAVIDLNGKTYRLDPGFHLIGRKSKKFNINDETVDEKHALFCILNDKHQIIDLESEKGVYVENKRINQSCIIKNKISSIQIGNVIIKYKIIDKSDSGFLDSKTMTPNKSDCEIVASSPEHSRYNKCTRIRYARNYCQRDSSTSLKSNLQNFENCIPTSDKIINEDKRQQNNNNLSVCSNKDECDKSFFVPETQQFEVPKYTTKDTKNIFDTILEDSVKQYINDMSRDDEYYVPETQEIFSNTKNIKYKDMVVVNTEDFNGSSYINTDSNESTSENLCPYIDNPFESDEERDNEFDKSKNVENKNEIEEMSKLVWNKNENDGRSNVTTPDIEFEQQNIEEVKQNDQVSLNAREGSITPDNIFEDEKSSATKISDSFKSNKNDNINVSINNEDIPTQLFLFPKSKYSPKLTKQIILNEDDSNFLEETQIFKPVLPYVENLSKKSPMKIHFDNSEIKNKKEEIATVKSIQNIRDEQQNIEEVKQNDQVSLNAREGSITPDNIFEDEKSSATKISDSFKSNKNDNINVSLNNEDIPTQLFLFSKSKYSPKLTKQIILNEDDSNFLEETQIFKPVLPYVENLSKKTPMKINFDNSEIKDKKEEISTVKSIQNIRDEIEEDDIFCTQAFVPPKQVVSFQLENQNNLINESHANLNFDDLDCTQAFVHPIKSSNSIFIPLASEKEKVTSNKSNQKELKETISVVNFKEKTAIEQHRTNRKRNNDIIKIQKDEIKEPSTKKKCQQDCTNVKLSSISSNKNFEGLVQTPSRTTAKSSTNPQQSSTEIDVNFMLDVCTPSFDLIKFPVEKQGYVKVFENIKKKNSNRIFEEESDEEDDEIEKLKSSLKENEPVENYVKQTSNTLLNKTGKSFLSTDKQILNKPTSGDSNKVKNSKSKIKNKVICEENAVSKLLAVSKKKINNENEILKKVKSNCKNAENTTEKRSNSSKQNFSDERQNEQRSLRSRRSTKSKKTSSLSDNHEELEMETKKPPPVRSTRNTRSNKLTVAFTKVNEAKYTETLKNIGYSIVNDPENATIIVTNNNISRTWKFLIGLAKGIPIISTDWLDKIAEKNFSFVPYDIFYVKDKCAEKKFNFSIRETINKAKKSCKPLFNDFNFILTESICPPKTEMERIIHCAGGNILDPTSKQLNVDIYVVSDKKDSNLWPTLQKKFEKLVIIKTEGILLSIMQHRIRFEDHIFN